MSFHSHPKILQSSRNFGNEISSSDMHYVPFPAHSTCLHPYDNGNTEDYEEPIDMSIKRKPETSHNDSETYRYKSLNDESSSLPLSSTYSVSNLTRPSVILNFDSLPPPPSYESTNKDRSSRKVIDVKNVLQTDGAKASSLKKKNESVDPDIDEHFRRSLGINYYDFMDSDSRASVTEPSDSVDDHFTKALGSTWIKLKNEKKYFNSMTSGNAVSKTDDHSPNLRGLSTSTNLDYVHNKLICSTKSNCNSSSCNNNVNNYCNSSSSCSNNTLCNKLEVGVESNQNKSPTNFKLLL